MAVEVFVFVLMAAAALAGALAVVLAKNPVYAAMGLLGTMLALAVLYVLNLAHMVAAVQIIVYAGAVMTLFLFVIMLVGVDRAEDTDESLPMQRRLVVTLAGLFVLAAGALALGGRFAWTPAAPPSVAIPNGTVEAIGGELFTNWLLPFQATALLLTIAAVGSIALAFFRRGPDEEEPS
ncbi:MAG: NADH-quinone oxidoreductase subunit J [Acidimicrobiia bacterium]|jgi:NADH-quinone oxidoreductase subunit J